MAQPAISVRDLSKVYRTYRKAPGLLGAVKGLFHREHTDTRAVDTISFDINVGETVGFLGPNGAGKTTALKMLSGLLQPSSGTASVLGFTPWDRKDAFKRQFSLLMGQKNALWWDLPARESLELNRVIYQIPRHDFQSTVSTLAELLEVADKMDVMVRELSLGERMKMELIAALLHRPKVLFLDEPTIGLDVTSQKRVRDFLSTYHREHPIVTMLTSHYMADIEELCQRVIIIDHGKLFYDGPLATIVDRFSAHKQIDLSFSRDVARADLPEASIIEHSGLTARLRIPRADVAETCRNLLAQLPITDFNVQDPSVEEVIRELFHHRSLTNSAPDSPALP
jgi:ABC-2 type transport system ATP-binding protein